MPSNKVLHRFHLAKRKFDHDMEDYYAAEYKFDTNQVLTTVEIIVLFSDYESNEENPSRPKANCLTSPSTLPSYYLTVRNKLLIADTNNKRKSYNSINNGHLHGRGVTPRFSSLLV